MIYIIRHGQTDRNKSGLLLGNTDVPLNDQGRREAEKARDYFRSHGITFQACYVSPMSRAMETAEIVTGLKRSEIQPNDLLMEMDYGPYEGISLHNPPEAIRVFFSDFVRNPAPEGMEPLDHVTARLGQFLEALPYDGNENILISTHAIAMKGALEYLMPDSKGSWWARYIGTCALFQFDKKNGQFTRPEEVLE